jgi:hypothetical protein
MDSAGPRHTPQTSAEATTPAKFPPEHLHTHFTRVNLDESPKNGLSGRSVPSHSVAAMVIQTARTNEEKWHANQVSSIKLRKNK